MLACRKLHGDVSYLLKKTVWLSTPPPQLSLLEPDTECLAIL